MKHRVTAKQIIPVLFGCVGGGSCFTCSKKNSHFYWFSALTWLDKQLIKNDEMIKREHFMPFKKKRRYLQVRPCSQRLSHECTIAWISLHVTELWTRQDQLSPVIRFSTWTARSQMKLTEIKCNSFLRTFHLYYVGRSTKCNTVDIMWVLFDSFCLRPTKGPQFWLEIAALYIDSI